MMPLRHGIDIEAVSNIRSLLAVSEHARLRVFTEREVHDCERAPDPVQRFAARFSAKEALFKALGRGWQGMGWTEAEVRVDEAGGPRFAFYGKLKARVEALGVRSISLSTSHTPDFAMASVILLCDPATPTTPQDP